MLNTFCQAVLDISPIFCIPQHLELRCQPSQETMQSFHKRTQFISPTSMQDTFPTYKSAGRFFRCEHCSYRSLYTGHLKRHIKYKHTGEKPFGCSFCSYRTVSKDSLKVHIRKHTKEKPYQCQICYLRFAYPSNLKRHKALHKQSR